MSETTTQIANDVEILPGTEITEYKQISNEIMLYKDANSSDKKTIDSLINQLDLEDSNSILAFGSDAQEEMSTISESMLEGVRNKDLGSTGAPLNDMIATIRGFDIDELNPNKN